MVKKLSVWSGITELVRNASFYQHPNIPDTFFGDEMHISSLELGRKRVELNVFESFKYFTKQLLLI